MASSGLNKVIIVGKVGKLPTLRYLDSGQAMGDLWIVCSGEFLTPNGRNETRSEWLPVRLWGEIAESTHQQCRKGDSVWLEGQLLSHSWVNPQGERQSRLELVAHRLERVVAAAAEAPPFSRAADPVASFDPLEALKGPEEPDEVPF